MAKAKPTTSTTSEIFDTHELVALARLDMDRGNVEAALAKLKQVLGGSEAVPEAQAMAAKIYAQLKLFSRAQQLYQDYLKSNPGAVTEQFQLGMTHYESNRPAEALKVWESLLKEFPTHPPALFYKALILSQQGRIADAKQCLDILLKSAAMDNLYFNRGKELMQALGDGAGFRDLKPEQKPRSGPLAPPDAYKTEH